MKKILFCHWHVMRVVRLAFALYLFTQAYYLQQWFFVAFGLFFFVQALLNLGCGAQGCRIPTTKKESHER